MEKNRPADTTPAVSAFDAVQYLEIDEALAGQRLDNFLIKILKGVPKSHIYRIVRGGEVRINKKRCAVDDRIQTGDVVRIPPIRVSQKREDEAVPAIDEKELPILFEDRDLLIVNKPAGLAAHGGSGVKFGLIERLRSARPDAKFLELAHRLDRDTSGAIIICKTRKALVRLHEMQREGEIHKHYRLLVAGDWVNDRQHVKAPLSKYVLPSGERRVKVDDVEGLKAHTIFTNLERFGDVTFLDAELKTGRTHQSRVHALSQGHPLVGDDKYGEYDFNDKVKKGCLGVKFGRMFLHAYRLDFVHPVTHDKMSIVAPMDKTLTGLIDALKARKNQ
ncbi:MAG: RluA family pseudouridine synthase [Sutterellaceae bacterium]|nr:RluA family pseudouridine synthase [Sutterellaceae bacterium]